MRDWIKIIIIIVIIIVFLFLGYFLINKFLLNNKKEEKAKTVNEIKDVYELGDTITFPKLKDVMFKNENDKHDFSKWKVLYQEKNYITLYSVADWGDVDAKMYYNEVNQHRKIMTQYKVFTGYSDDFRLLGNKELELFSCNIYNMTCLDVPSWIGDSLTSFVNEKGKPIVFKDNKMIVSDGDRAVYHPVIRITKDKIE